MDRKHDISKSDPSVTRVLVVGGTKSGKTLLLRRLCHEIYCTQEEKSVYFDTPWSPTVGFYVDALIRNVDSAVEPQSYKDVRRSSPTTSPTNTSLVNRVTSSERLGAFTSLFKGKTQRSRSPMETAPGYNSRMQTVEFYELGGNQTMVNGCWLTIGSIAFDGVLIMYNRAEVDSLKFALSMYYALVPTVLRSSPSVSLNQGEAVDSGVQPPFLLVGTNITAPPYSSRQEEEAIPDEALMHSNLDAVIKERKRNAARHAPSAVGNALQVLSEMVRCFTSPGTILSVQNQEGLSKLEEDCQSCGAVRSTYQWCVSLIAHVVYFFDNLCSYVMAVILFGPRQRFVSLDQRGNTELIGRITRDAQCVGHLAACPLYSSIHFDESVTELTNFLDLLHQKKCAS